MPLRTIADAVFSFKTAEGPYVAARRGETIDVPEGEDLIRGDKFGSFTAVVGQEPAPPDDTFVPDILVAWSSEEFNRFVDSATADEILDKLNAVAPEDRAAVARSLIEAEHGHKERARLELLAALANVTAAGESQSIVDVTTTAQQAGPYTELLTKPVAEVLEFASANADVAEDIRLAEESSDKPRKSLIEGLAKIVPAVDPEETPQL